MILLARKESAYGETAIVWAIIFYVQTESAMATLIYLAGRTAIVEKRLYPVHHERRGIFGEKRFLG